MNQLSEYLPSRIKRGARNMGEIESRLPSQNPRPFQRSRGWLAVAGSLSAWLRHEVAALDPACFALVMATGIVSNSLFLEGYPVASNVLLALNLGAYPWLCLLTGWRAARFGRALRGDLFNPRMVFSFFTFVAATDVLGLALDLRGFTTFALSLWSLAIIAWFALIYLGFGVLLLRNNQDGADVANGAWLNGIVGTQSLVLLGSHAVPAESLGPSAAMLIYALWMLGLALYGVYAVLLSHRAFFFDLKAADVTPILWVVMGAAAISANAGATLAAGNSYLPFLHSIQPFVGGVTLALWGWATWWIPLLLLLGIWKHLILRTPITYTPVLWSIVFPLGMYAVTSLRVSRLAGVPSLETWAWTITWIALAAWAATWAALGVASLRSLRAGVALAES
ncbi:MAG TPA: tellurite resistance/C4-dicarboxylate transporter family protein [Xanthobacteraceae bacterium]|nr:tellurite resistance/C4-dicarboxylate transporter family protein [Xanthobacteraceae bacterium]